MLIKELAPYFAVVTAVIAAYLTYRNQLRLKTFELLFERRNDVLKDLEEFLTNLYDMQFEFKNGGKSETVERYTRQYFHDGLILFHKVKGANFGGSVDVMAETFWSIITEPTTNDKSMSRDTFEGWVSRKTNVVSTLYALAHGQLTKDLEQMAFSPLSRLLRKHRNRPRVDKKANKANSADAKSRAAD